MNARQHKQSTDSVGDFDGYVAARFTGDVTDMLEDILEFLGVRYTLRHVDAEAFDIERDLFGEGERYTRHLLSHQAFLDALDDAVLSLMGSFPT